MFSTKISKNQRINTNTAPNELKNATARKGIPCDIFTITSASCMVQHIDDTDEESSKLHSSFHEEQPSTSKGQNITKFRNSLHLNLDLNKNASKQGNIYKGEDMSWNELTIIT